MAVDWQFKTVLHCYPITNLYGYDFSGSSCKDQRTYHI